MTKLDRVNVKRLRWMYFLLLLLLTVHSSWPLLLLLWGRQTCDVLDIETEEELSVMSPGNNKCSLAALMLLGLPVSCHDVNITICMTQLFLYCTHNITINRGLQVRTSCRINLHQLLSMRNSWSEVLLLGLFCCGAEALNNVSRVLRAHDHLP